MTGAVRGMDRCLLMLRKPTTVLTVSLSNAKTLMGDATAAGTIRDWCVRCRGYVSHFMGSGWIKCDDCGRHTNTNRKE